MEVCPDPEMAEIYQPDSDSEDKWLVRYQKEERLRVWWNGQFQPQRWGHIVPKTHSENERGMTTVSEQRRPTESRLLTPVSGCHVVPSAQRSQYWDQFN